MPLVQIVAAGICIKFLFDAVDSEKSIKLEMKRRIDLLHTEVGDLQSKVTRLEAEIEKLRGAE